MWPPIRVVPKRKNWLIGPMTPPPHPPPTPPPPQIFFSFLKYSIAIKRCFYFYFIIIIIIFNLIYFLYLKKLIFDLFHLLFNWKNILCYRGKQATSLLLSMSHIDEKIHMHTNVIGFELCTMTKANLNCLSHTHFCNFLNGTFSSILLRPNYINICFYILHIYNYYSW